MTDIPKRIYVKRSLKVNKTADRAKYQREYLKLHPEKRKQYQLNFYTKVFAQIQETQNVQKPIEN